MQRILVTGTNGFIPSYVIEELHAKRYYVVGLQRSARSYGWKTKETTPDEVYYGDVRDEALIHKSVEQVDGVIHLAAILGTSHTDNVWPWYENNVKGTINVLEACKDFNIPMVYITVGNYFEHNNYSNTKVAAEREVMKYAKYHGVRANLVRALNAVGPRQKVKNTGKIMSTFATLALEGRPLQVYGGKDGCSKMDLVYAGDVARVLVDVLERTMTGQYKPGQKYEAGTGEAPTVYEIAQMVIEAAGSRSVIEEVPMRFGETPNSTVVAENPYPLIGTTGKGYKPMKEVIAETVEYYKKDMGL